MTYATVAQARARLSPYFDGLEDAEVETFLSDASSELDTILSAAFELPLTEWPEVLTQCTVHVGGYRASVEKGFNPQGESSHIRQLYEDAIATAKRIVENNSRYGFSDATPDVEEGSPGLALSDDARGWDD